MQDAIVVSIPASVNYNPPAHALPPSMLEESSYTPDEPERARWARLLALLPEDRQRRLAKCGRFAVHVCKTTSAGTAEGLQPVSCGDKTACPYCATRYQTEQAADRVAKLLILTKAGRAGLTVVEARAHLPAWSAGVSAAGCSAAEARGRLCGPDAGCSPCASARPLHAAAAAAEARLRAALVHAWSAAAAGTGGVYTVAVEPVANGDLELAVRLLVPGLVFHPAGDDAALGWYVAPAAAALEQTWQAACAAAGGTGRLAIREATTDKAITREILDAHLPVLERLERARGVISVAAICTLVRADGLAGLTKTGKMRRVQRTAWFGALAGPMQAAALRVLGLAKQQKDTSATTAVQDHYKILAKDADRVTVQSTRTAIIRTFPIEFWRGTAYCGLNGAPLTAPDPVQWARTAPWIEQLEKARLVRRGAGFQVAGFALEKTISRRSALKKEWHSVILPSFAQKGVRW